MTSKANRYQSRILREMHQNNENPFHSPPSSTGSHGTVTLTSEFSLGPEGESTRRMQEDSVELPHAESKQTPLRPLPFKINTSALGRNFPEWRGWNPDPTDQSNFAQNLNVNLVQTEIKENIPPSSSTIASPGDIKLDKKYKVAGGTSRTRSEMQARVDNASDCSSNATNSPHAQRVSRKRTHQETRPQAPSPNHMMGSASRDANVTTLLKTLRNAQNEAAPRTTPPRESAPQTPPKSTSPRQVSQAERIQRDRRSHILNSSSIGTPNQTNRSFFLPNMSHVNDFVSGALRVFSTKNGVPIFVRNGQVHDWASRSGDGKHFEVDGIEIPEDEQKIFVSMDKIREEIHALQAHDDQMAKQADELQQEVEVLQLQLARYRSRKDSAVGSDSESSMIENLHSQKSELQAEIADLKSRLDKANRKTSINEIHLSSIKAERDETLKQVSEAYEKVTRLQGQLDSTQRELGSATRLQGSHKQEALEMDNKSLRADNNTLRTQYQTALDENQSLRSHNTVIKRQNQELQEELEVAQQELEAARDESDALRAEMKTVLDEKAMIKQDNHSLERNNDKFYSENKSLQHKVDLLERRIKDLQDDIARLHSLIDAVNQDQTTAEVKDIRERLEKRNRDLADENSRLEQKLIDIQADFAMRLQGSDREKKKLHQKNEDLHDKLDRYDTQYSEVLAESRRKVSEYEEKQVTLNLQLQQIAEKEAELVQHLKTSAEQEDALQDQIERTSEAVSAARRLNKELESLRQQASNLKVGKVTRIIEPDNTKGKYTSTTDISAKSGQSQVDTQQLDDFTRQIDLTQGSDFANLFVKSADLGLNNTASQQLPALPVQQKPVSASQPSGILKNGQDVRGSKGIHIDGIAAQNVNRTDAGTYRPKSSGQGPKTIQDDTGRFSVKSGFSALSHTRSDILNNHRRQTSENVRFDPDLTMSTEENMTSAFFMPDITLDSNENTKTSKKTANATGHASRSHVKGQSQSESKSVLHERSPRQYLNSLHSDHDARNCTVCARINSHRHETGITTKDVKKTVKVSRPVPVTETYKEQYGSADDLPADVTVRPAMAPGEALAYIHKQLRDQRQHLIEAHGRKLAEYNALDPALGRRKRKELSAEIQRLSKEIENLNDMLYNAHDVLEGQKVAGQEMQQEEFEATIMSFGLPVEITWDGIKD